MEHLYYLFSLIRLPSPLQKLFIPLFMVRFASGIHLKEILWSFGRIKRFFFFLLKKKNIQLKWIFALIKDRCGLVINLVGAMKVSMNISDFSKIFDI